MKLAFVFPGQGSQTLGMLSDLAKQHPEVTECYNQASEVLGYDLWHVVQHDQTKLSQTEVTQPALLTASYAIFKILSKVYPELTPEMMAGHSLGEYSALTCAGVLDFKDAVKLVQLRGQAMQTAVPTGGAMYAIIGLDDQTIIDTCNQFSQELGQTVAAVNFNSPGQVVIAGTSQACEQVANALKAKGAKRALLLPVSVPSHCALMKPAAQAMAQEFAKTTFHPAKVPVMHNTDLSISTTKEACIDALTKQLVGPVLWTQTINKLCELGFTHFIEVGPGKVLTGLSGRINKATKIMEVNSIASLEKVTSFTTNS